MMWEVPALLYCNDLVFSSLPLFVPNGMAVKCSLPLALAGLD